MNETPESKCFERAAAPNDAGTRLDQFWSRELSGSGISRERIKDWIVGGFAKIGGKACRKPGHRLEGDEKLALLPPAFSIKDSPGAEDGPLPVVYRDDDLVVIDKPAMLATHPAPGKPDGTLVNRLLHHFPQLLPETSGMEGERPGIVHRLDKDTTGLIMVALNEGTRLALSKAFAARAVSKTYLAIVHGRPKAELVDQEAGDANTGRIDLPIGRHPSIRTKMAVLPKGGREARTSWRRLWTDRLGRASLMAVRLHTGRTHQIRVHLAHIGHPLLGDPVYGPAQHALWGAHGGPLAGLAPRQMLHAFRLAFRHPRTGEVLDIRRDPPEDFSALLNALEADCQRVVLTGMPGCGKSALLRALGRQPQPPPTFSADACVAALYAPGADGATLIARSFGRELLDESGGVDRPRLLALLQEKPSLRRELEDIIHPLVQHALREFWAAHASAPLAVAEVPLFLEAGWRSGSGEAKSSQPDVLADVLVGVRCPEEMRQGAMRESRGLTPETLAAFDSWQWPAERKLSACDLVIDNDGGLEGPDGLDGRAKELLAALAAQRQERARLFKARQDALLDAVAGETVELPGEDLDESELDWEEDEA
ncbi:MAG: dephospho-CoA kinase [Humidesulfovibrio sp.]|uniref:dephospho-CoA kinase n=1 Tax=Humidesulfovibrio sp. TaxID=2910988 RepID=UPI0027F93672|nr:dephospho-CoA kinase [Humidesulfovibrio sp.]MDQ7834150.1 dephospho-CoA kinase [Humidesulfovibrio sp.]